MNAFIQCVRESRIGGQSGCFLGFDSLECVELRVAGWGSALGRIRVSDGGELLLLVFILHESTVKATLSGEEARECCTKVGDINPL